MGSPSYAAMVASPSTSDVVAAQPITSNSGTDIGVTFQQPVSYGDNASIGTDTYRAVVTYEAGQGF